MRKQIIAVVGVLILLTGCSKNATQTAGQLQIAKVREQIASDMDKLTRGDYKNLIATKFHPVFPESNEWHSVLIDQSEICSEKKGKELAEEIEEDYCTMKKVFGKRLYKKNVEVAMLDENEDEKRYAYGDTFLKEVRAGKYEHSKYEFIMFELSKEQSAQYMWLCQNRKDVMFMDKKKNVLENDTDETVLTDIYFPNTDKKDKKSYKLYDGTEVTMQEAVDMASEWMKKFPVEQGGEPPVAKRVMVEKTGKEAYQFTINLVGQYNGILFDDFIGMESKETSDSTEYHVKSVVLKGKNEVPYYVNYGNGEKIQDTGDVITQCLTLDQALTTVSEKIGVAADYTINSIEIAYRVKEDTSKNPKSDLYGYPVWEMETVNNVDKKETRFYVNAVNGEVEVDLGSNMLTGK